MSLVNTRQIILEILMEVLEKKQHSHIVINAVLDRYDYFERSQKSFIKRTSEGTIENLIQIDYVINKFSKIKVKKMKPEIRNILRLSVYQILYMKSVPDYSVCDEAVKLTVATKKYRNLKGFVNGCLRSICREKDDIVYPNMEIEYSIPDWISAQWSEQYGAEMKDKIVRQFKNNHFITIHTGLNTTQDKLKQELTKENVIVEPVEGMEGAFRISGYESLTDLDSFKNGLFYVQDISSMMAVNVANPKENDFVIDVCAAPGGKSILSAVKMNDKGHIISRDLTQRKADLLNDNLTRLKINCIEAQVFDATVLDESLIGKADVLICDVPCSGLGVIGNKSDIKYNMSLEQQEELVKLQRNILNVVSEYVKPGGTLIYSTCTTNKNENINNARWFIDHFPYEMESIDKFIPDKYKCETTKEGYLQLLQGVHDCDGFFICRLIRK